MKFEMRLPNVGQFRGVLKSEMQRTKKASSAAAKVEGYRLVKEMKAEMRAAAPGGKGFSPLSVIRSGKLTGGRKPLSKMAITPRYATIDQGDQSKTMVGFLRIKLSRKWVMLAERHQDSFETNSDAASPVGSTYRKLFARIGSSIKNKAIAKYYFLKKTTKVLKTPARMIVVPFWQAHQAEAGKRIVSNFERKMRGERI